MKKRPIFIFATEADTGINTLPIGSLIMVDNYATTGSKSLVKLNNTGLLVSTSISAALTAGNIKDLSVAGTALTANKLTTPVTINGTSFDGSANITLPTPSVATSADKLTTPVTINGTSFDGSANITLPASPDATKLPLTGGTMSGAIASLRETAVTVPITAGALATASVSGNLVKVNLNANITSMTFPSTGFVAGEFYNLIFEFTADGTARSITWPASVKWAGGGTAPTLTSTLNKKDVFSLYTTDAGVTWNAFKVGQNV